MTLRILLSGFSILLALFGVGSTQTKEVLFDGVTLSGWHVQGPGQWTVSAGRIRGYNPTAVWGHLVSNKTYRNGYVRLKFMIVAGNTGLYVRGTEGGNYGAKGIQVDFGWSSMTGDNEQDGSAMLVTDNTYTWYQLLTTAKDSGWVNRSGWNEMAVDMQGTSLRTYVNGHLIWSSNLVTGMDTTGILALQLHDGERNDVFFKDIEVLLPTRVPHCPIPTDPAYRPGNDPDSTLCRGTVAIRQKITIGKNRISDWDHYFNLLGIRIQNRKPILRGYDE